MYHRVLAYLDVCLAEGLRIYSQSACSHLGVPSAESKKLLQLVEVFSNKVETHSFPFSQAFRMLKEFDRGPLFQALVLIGFKNRFLNSENTYDSPLLPLCPKFDEFSREWKAGRIASQTMLTLIDLLTECREYDFAASPIVVAKDKASFLKDDLSSENIASFSDLMRDIKPSSDLASSEVSIDIQRVFDSVFSSIMKSK
ncbi:MAG: hypothetical protein HQM08_04010 [Candidatus Riflebacteria bacterium]|nr:hypothetical protein [Candidatus Riflebacteria bacterium]